MAYTTNDQAKEFLRKARRHGATVVVRRFPNRRNGTT